MNKIVVTMDDIKRYKVITEVIEKRLTLKDASELLFLSYRHAIRLKQKVKDSGLEGILRKIPASAPNRQTTKQVVDKILKHREELYYDFNIMHFKDKLEEVHNIHLSYESLRQILIKTGKHEPKKKKIIHRQRRRMPKAGMLVQMDSSQHLWLEHIPEKWWLVAMIDDATNEIAYAGFFPKDTVFANMHIIRRFIEIKGIFMSLYVDKASHFTTTRIEGIHYSVSQEQEDTQIERALEELGITLIPANSPQAKGRIEVTFRLFQDRLIKEMRLAGVKSYDEANHFLIEKFLPWYNPRYTHEAESAYMPVPKEKDLDLIFCIKRQRTVNKDNTISFNGQVIQIPPADIRRSFAKTKVVVCLLEDNRVFVLYENKIIAQTVLSEDNKAIVREKKIEELLNRRQYIPLKRPSVKRILPKTVYIPPANHPWRKALAKGVKLKQMRQNKM
ncbi:MAG: hypothetical protein A3J72_09215 [Nitrospirae bacterium RIFCSPHIGHO2_02_FULL_40_19]|nr:MAG: hypothetical protein A3J72_09215 [Nitrospirae bacterium RIFCSPHIGHO2_02_FULL_40_19]